MSYLSLGRGRSECVSGTKAALIHLNCLGSQAWHRVSSKVHRRPPSRQGYRCHKA